MQIFSSKWIDWINTNTAAGVPKDILYGILLQHGFSYADVQKEMGYTPSMSLDMLLHPFRAPHEFLQNYTRAGFKKFLAPQPLFDKILTFYNENKAAEKDEYVEGYIFNAQAPGKSTSTTIELPEAMRTEIHDTLKPIVAAWSGKSVDPTFVYGIRIYKDKAVLKPHRDRIQTHIFGVIINVAQDIREDWLLMIEDHAYDQHQIVLKPGEMIFYESARLKHGRPIPLEGNAYANVFTHFKPSDYNPAMGYDTAKSTVKD